MLPTESTKAFYFKRYIEDGDLVIVYERNDVMKPVKVSKGGVLHFRTVLELINTLIRSGSRRDQRVEQQG